MKSEITIVGKQLRIVRTFSAPRSLVFSYWKDPAKMEKWSGCKEARDCRIEMDFREGGFFTQKMHIIGAGDFSLTGEYDEIIEPERISYRAQLGNAKVRILVEFIERDGATTVVMTHDGFPDEFLCKTVSQGTAEGLEKLEYLLAHKPETGRMVCA